MTGDPRRPPQSMSSPASGTSCGRHRQRCVPLSRNSTVVNTSLLSPTFSRSCTLYYRRAHNGDGSFAPPRPPSPPSFHPPDATSPCRV